MSNLINSIKLHEGLRLKPYKDIFNYTTIGYGRNLDTNGISKEEAEILLNNDINNIIKTLNKYKWYNDINIKAQDIVIEMTYNLGITSFLNFKNFIEYLRQKNYTLAGLEMINSKWHKQLPQRSNELYNKMINIT